MKKLGYILENLKQQYFTKNLKKSEFTEENGRTTKLGGMLLVPYVHLSTKSVSFAAVCSSLYAVSMCVASTDQNHHLMPWRS